LTYKKQDVTYIGVRIAYMEKCGILLPGLNMDMYFTRMNRRLALDQWSLSLIEPIHTGNILFNIMQKIWYTGNIPPNITDKSQFNGIVSLKKWRIFVCIFS